MKSPEPFDDHLPAIEREDLDYLQREVPQLSPHLKSVPEFTLSLYCIDYVTLLY